MVDRALLEHNLRPPSLQLQKKNPSLEKEFDNITHGPHPALGESSDADVKCESVHAYGASMSTARAYMLSASVVPWTSSLRHSWKFKPTIIFTP
ncbi:unnamed protein product [Dovyalis caffra]|uniref:Uncharacterized protein n=1 Tax=Dovyalis caffra TaxID=77055 RepID=A0AAV1RT49_9ROSI|nr:unnamed protein product [Dovyalis caffra]